MPQAFIVPRPEKGTPEAAALLAARKENAMTGSYHQQPSTRNSALSLKRDGREVVIEFKCGTRELFRWTYFILDGRAFLTNAPAFFKLQPDDQATVEGALRAYALRLDGKVVA